MPLLQNIMLSIFPPEKRISNGDVRDRYWTCSCFRPTLSGYIIDNYHWRDLFGMVLPIVVLVLVLAFFLMKVLFHCQILALIFYPLFYQRLDSVVYFTDFLV